MTGLVEEGQEVMDEAEKKEDAAADLALIGAAQRVEHYEMAGYGTARALATRLGESAAANTLGMTLQEEGAADKKLTSIAESQVNAAAAIS